MFFPIKTGSEANKDSPLLLFWYKTGDFPNDDDWQVWTSRKYRQQTVKKVFMNSTKWSFLSNTSPWKNIDIEEEKS